MFIAIPLNFYLYLPQSHHGRYSLGFIKCLRRVSTIGPFKAAEHIYTGKEVARSGEIPAVDYLYLNCIIFSSCVPYNDFI